MKYKTFLLIFKMIFSYNINFNIRQIMHENENPWIYCSLFIIDNGHVFEKKTHLIFYLRWAQSQENKKLGSNAH